MIRKYQPLESVIREILEGKTLHEADNVGERGIIATNDPGSTSEPTQAPDKDKAKKKKENPQDKDDPHTITIGKVTPVDLQPTTDQPKIADLNDKKDKKIVEEKAKTIGKGIHFGNYHRSIRKRVMNIIKTNQNLADKHQIRPREGQEANEERIENKTEKVLGLARESETVALEHRYTDWEQRKLDQESGKRMDSLDRDRKRKAQAQAEKDQEKNKTEKDKKVEELAKPELDRIAMYHRAGNAEADKKRPIEKSTKEKVIKFVRSARHKIYQPKPKFHEETIEEAPQFDPFTASGQLLGNVLRIMAHSHGKRNSAAKHQQQQQRQPAPKPTKSVPPIETSKPERPAEPTKPFVFPNNTVRAWKGIQYIQDVEKNTGKKFSFVNRNQDFNQIDWRKKKPLTGMMEGRMKDWLMDMQDHVEQLHQEHKGDIPKMKEAFLKKYPNQDRVFHDHVRYLRGDSDDSRRYWHEMRPEETVNEARHSKGGGAKRAGLSSPLQSGDQHIINQLRIARNIGSHKVLFKDKSTAEIDRTTAHKALDHYEGLRTTIDKEALINRLWASNQSFNDFIAGKPAPDKPSSGPSLPHGFKPKGIFAGTTGASKNPVPRETKVAQPISSKELNVQPIKYRPKNEFL